MALPEIASAGTKITRWGVALALYPGDPDFAYEIERAPDNAGSPDTGNSVFYEEEAGAQRWVGVFKNDGQPYHYRVRHIRDGWIAGPWTDWIKLLSVRLPDDIPIKPPGDGTLTVAPSFLAWIPNRQELPETPTGLSGEEGGTQNTVVLTWTDNATDELEYHVERAPDVSGSPGTWNILTIGSPLAANSTNYTDTDSATLSTQSLWWYRVRCRSAYGYSAYSNQDQVDLSLA